MQFAVDRDQFSNAINHVIGGVEKRQTMQVLSNVLLEVADGRLTLVATDLEIQLSTALEIQMRAPGATTVNARKLADIVKSASQNAEIIVTQAEGWLEIDIGSGVFKLALIEASSFPQMTVDTASQSSLTIRQKNLYALIEKTQFSMAQQDVRYFLNGLLLEIKPGQITAVATDGHRLAYARLYDEQLTQTRQVIVPRKMVSEILKALNRDSDADVSLALRDNQIELSIGENHLISKLIDGKYPDYTRVIPQANSKILIVSKTELKQVLQRASILSNERFSGAYFHLSSGRLTIESSNAEHESSKETLSVGYDADELKTSFNNSYLLNILAVIDSEEVCMELDLPESSVLIKPVMTDAIDSLYVLMPMKL